MLRPSKRSRMPPLGRFGLPINTNDSRQRRAGGGEVALLDRRDSRALRVAEDDERFARGLARDRLVEVGHTLPDRLVEGHGARHRHELLGCADGGGRARLRPGAAESGQHDVVVVGVGGVAVDEFGAVLRRAQRMPGAAHDQRGRGEGDQRRHGLHAHQHDRGRDRQEDDTGGIEESAHSEPPEADIAVGRPRSAEPVGCGSCEFCDSFGLFATKCPNPCVMTLTRRCTGPVMRSVVSASWPT